MSKEQTPITAEYISLIQNQIDSIKDVLHVCDKQQKERLEFKITILEDVKHLINNHSYKEQQYVNAKVLEALEREKEEIIKAHIRGQEFSFRVGMATTEELQRKDALEYYETEVKPKYK